MKYDGVSSLCVSPNLLPISHVVELLFFVILEIDIFGQYQEQASIFMGLRDHYAGLA